MSITLPTYFKSDIQGSNTNLVPFVLIGNNERKTIVDEEHSVWDKFYFLSTNRIRLGIAGHDSDDVAMGERESLPLLLNIPSLKESIDIEKRKYKISSVNIDISNYKYNGIRFSELITDSLINTECRVYWSSPGTTSHALHDYSNPGPSDAFQVYFGTIRKYTHDDEKAQLVLEDRSQATLHRKIPISELGAEGVLDKYKNQTIPMVYGEVRKSPLVIASTTIEEDSTIDGNYKLIADNQDASTTILQYEHLINNAPTPLYLHAYRDDKYCGILMTGMEPVVVDFHDLTNYANLVQYSPSPDFKSIIVFGNYGEESVGGGNPISNNEAFAYFRAEPINTKLYQEEDNFSVQTGTLLHQIKYDANNITGLTDIGQLITVEDVELTFYKYRLNYKMTKPPTAVNYGRESNYYIIPRVNYSLTALNILLGEGIAGSIPSTIVLQYVYQRRDYHYLLGELFGTMLIHNIDTTDNVFISGETWSSLEQSGWDVVGEPGIFGEGAGFQIETIHTDPFSMAHAEVALTVHWQTLEYFFVIDKFIESDFYANVRGRAMNGELSPTAPSAIKHILENELGQEDIVLTDANYSTWQYAFCQNTKINSKKLIEGIASASPYIPRFNNMGEFKFDVIKQEYHFDEPIEQDHIIKEEDVISNSFSRTSIDDVYTRIEFKYNWDYARGEFSDLAHTDDTLLPDYKFDYYGLKEDHSESTLIIDDDRGKYIRHANDNGETAQGFALWMLWFHCNQHLKIKVRLPLKYMNIEIGDLVQFDKIIGDVKPYGISYDKDAHWIDDGQGYHGDRVNGQQVYPFFMVFSTNKTMEYCEIECMQMHNLTGSYSNRGVYGVTDGTAWNHGELTSGGYADNVDDIDFHDPSIALIPPSSFPSDHLDPSIAEASGANDAFNARFKKTDVCPVLLLPFDVPEGEAGETYASNFPEDVDDEEIPDILYYNNAYDIATARELWLSDNDAEIELYSIHQCAWEDVNEHDLVKVYPGYGEYWGATGEAPFQFMDNSGGSLNLPLLFTPTFSNGQQVGFKPDYAGWWDTAPFGSGQTYNWIYLRFNQLDLYSLVHGLNPDELFLHFDWYALLQVENAFPFKSVKIEVINEAWMYDAYVDQLDAIGVGTDTKSFTVGHSEYDGSIPEQNWQEVHSLLSILSSYDAVPQQWRWDLRIFTVDLKITVTNEHYIENTTYIKLRLGTNNEPVSFEPWSYGP